MKILFQHNTLLPVVKYGGTERILFWHMRELVRRGHEVLFLGPRGSCLDKFKIKFIPTEDGDWRPLIPEDIDLIHLFGPTHLDFDFPVLMTVQGNGQVGETFHPNTVFVSQAHAKVHNSCHFVYNGLDFSEYPFFKKKKKSWQEFFFLAKANWKVKNLKQAISACRSVNKKLHVAGGRHFYFSAGVKGHGMVNQIKKREIAKRCDALLFPVLWDEPFGIAIIEAWAFGLPVIGSAHGSLRELIGHGPMGASCESYDIFCEVLGRLENAFDREEIRSYAEEFFSMEKVTDHYLQYYDKILRGEALHSYRPGRVASTSPENLLPF